MTTNTGRLFRNIQEKVTNTSTRAHILLLLAIIALGFLLILYSLVAGQG